MLLDQLAQIVNFVVENFLNLWPYLLLSIPLAVTVRVSNASAYIRKAFVSHPLLAIALATAVGAFSPFCACSVVPLITSLLIAGVPLGPVMAFWIASPTMDPEIFLLSLGMLGPELAVGRVVATLAVSMGAGITAHVLEQRGFFRDGILREQKLNTKLSLQRLTAPLVAPFRKLAPQPAYQAASLISLDAIPVMPTLSAAAEGAACSTALPGTPSSCGSAKAEPTLQAKIWKETLSVTLMIAKFMLIAFVLEALITLYVPQTAIISLLGTGNPAAIVSAALIGVPVYTTNLTALPLIGGLLEQGMLPGAALAFLIAGPVTTIPAMSAVFGIAKPRVFALYVGVALVGAVVMGYAYQLLA